MFPTIYTYLEEAWSPPVKFRLTPLSITWHFKIDFVSSKACGLQVLRFQLVDLPVQRFRSVVYTGLPHNRAASLAFSWPNTSNLAFFKCVWPVKFEFGLLSFLADLAFFHKIMVKGAKF